MDSAKLPATLATFDLYHGQLGKRASNLSNGELSEDSCMKDTYLFVCELKQQIQTDKQI